MTWVRPGSTCPALPAEVQPTINAANVLSFWFKEHGPEDWFKKGESFDDLVRDRFLPVYEAAVSGELQAWRGSPPGRLAEILVLD